MGFDLPEEVAHFQSLRGAMKIAVRSRYTSSTSTTPGIARMAEATRGDTE